MNTIALDAGNTYSLTAVNNGEAGLPLIAASGGGLTILGNGSTIERSAAAGIAAEPLVHEHYRKPAVEKIESKTSRLAPAGGNELTGVDNGDTKPLVAVAVSRGGGADGSGVPWIPTLKSMMP